MDENKEKGIEAGREVLRKYLLDDCLRPQYNGMTAWELAKLVIEAYEAQQPK